MKYRGVNKDGSTFPADALLGMTETEIVWHHPLAEKIIHIETEKVVWHRNKAYYPGDYDPGTKTLK